MRNPTTVDVVRLFMREIGRTAKTPAQVFFTGGVTAIHPAPGVGLEPTILAALQWALPNLLGGRDSNPQPID